MPPERFSEYVIDIDETMRMEPSELIDKLVQWGICGLAVRNMPG